MDKGNADLVMSGRRLFLRVIDLQKILWKNSTGADNKMDVSLLHRRLADPSPGGYIHDIVGELDLAGATPHKPMEKTAVPSTSLAEPTGTAIISSTRDSSLTVSSTVVTPAGGACFCQWS